MKQIFTIVLALALAASCSKDVVISKAESTPITFSNVFIDKSTRSATDITYGNSPAVALEKFNIYGIVTGNSNTVNIYNGDEVTGTVDGAWSCTKAQYWVEKCKYEFVALVDATAKVTDGTNTNTVIAENLVNTDDNGIPTSISYDVRTQKDLLYARASRDLDVETPSYAPVQLTFQHLLSKITFTFTNAFASASGVVLRVKDIQIKTRQNATYNFTKWSDPVANEAVSSVSFGNTETIQPGNQSADCANVGLLIPGEYIGEGKKLQISFVVEHNKGGEDTSISTYLEVNLLAGNSYNFTAELNSATVSGVVPIRFTITPDQNWDGTGNNPSVDY